jgi:cell division protein FtsN
MFAFSLSRLALAGLVVTLLLGLALAFLAGRLTAPPRQITPSTKAEAALPAAPPSPSTQAEAKPAAPAAATPAVAPTQPAAANAPAPSPLAAAMEGPLARFGAAPPADPKAPAPEPTPAAGPRSTPRELNPELGKLADAARPVYTVEVGEYPNALAADQVVQRLALGSYDVYRVAGWVPQGRPPVLSVRVGAFDQRAAADAAATELRAREGLEARVLRVDPATIGTVKPAAKK